jgi:transposase-like protein
MAKHRTHSIEFKRRVVQDYLGGETLYGLAKRYEISRTLIRVWLAKHEAGVLDSDTAARGVARESHRRRTRTVWRSRSPRGALTFNHGD